MTHQGSHIHQSTIFRFLLLDACLYSTVAGRTDDFVSCCWWATVLPTEQTPFFLKLSYRPNPNSASSSKCNSYLRQPILGQTAPVLEILKQPYKTITYPQPSRTQYSHSTRLVTIPAKLGSLPLVIKQGVTLRGDESTKGKNTLISGGGRYISPTFARQDVTLEPRKIAPSPANHH